MMISSRWTNVRPPAVTIAPPFGLRANAPSLTGVPQIDRAQFNSERRRYGLDCAELAAAGNLLGVPQDCRARQAGRDLLEQLQPFCANSIFDTVKPVALPPGRAKLSTNPPPTGSAMATNTIGTVRVTVSNGDRPDVPVARMTSGASAANSAPSLRKRAKLLPGQRTSIRALRPSTQPNSCSRCRNAAKRAFDSE